jgi:hypothetical protein
MSRRIRILQRIVEHIRVPIQRLRLARPRHHRIRAHEPPKQRVVITGVVIIQPNPRFLALPGELEIGGRRAALPSGPSYINAL